MPLHKEYDRVAPGVGRWKCEVERSGDGTEYWNLQLLSREGNRLGDEYNGYNYDGLRHKLRYLTMLEAETPKGIFKALTAIPRYRVEPVPSHAGIFDVFIENNKWLGRVNHVQRNGYPSYSYWQVIWMPEHPGHRQPEHFKSVDEAAQWMLHHRKYTSEAETPKGIFKQVTTIPPPPTPMLMAAIEKKQNELKKHHTWTNIGTNPRGETFCYAGFGRRENEVVSTLLFWDRNWRKWTEVEAGTFAEAEDPKQVMVAAREPHQMVRNSLRRAEFKQTSVSDRYEAWERPTLPGTSGTTAQMVRFLWNGQYVWDYTVFNNNTVAWTTSAMTPERAVAFIKRHYFHHATGELFR